MLIFHMRGNKDVKGEQRTPLTHECLYTPSMGRDHLIVSLTFSDRPRLGGGGGVHQRAGVNGRGQRSEVSRENKEL